MSGYIAIPSSQLALTGQYPPKTFVNISELRKSIAAISKRLKEEDISQYIALKHVSEQDFEYLDEHRSELSNTVRFTYFANISTLIVKIPTMAHEVAHRTFGEEISYRFRLMGLTSRQFCALGSTKYVGPTASQKEADSSWKNARLRPSEGDWPSLVIEGGVSESMPRLRQDAAWWISNSGGQVQIVILIKVSRTNQRMVFEKYFPKLQNYPNAGAGVCYIPELV